MPICGIPRSDVERQSSDVRVELVDRVLHYEVTETYVNRGSRVGEADYMFPLPKGAALQDLKLSINGEMVAGETMSSDRARQIYEQIVRQQRDPALLEWMGYGLLRARIFPIAPGETKKVVVRFQSVAEREGDALRIDYFRGLRNAQRGGNGSPEGTTSFTLTYPDERIYGAAYSPTHSISSIDQGSTRRVEVRDASGEITLLIPVRKPASPAITLLANAPGNDDGFALITLTPPAMAPRAVPRDVTFVIDVSGSMSGKKIEQARAAGRQLLQSLSPADRFRFIDFSTDVRTFRDGYAMASSDNIRAAERYLDALEAEGSTNIGGALDQALAAPIQSGRLPIVLFLTDGLPTIGETNGDVIASRVAGQRGSRRLFTFGVGSDLNISLIEQLALEGRGTASFVRPGESVERAVGIVASRLTNPLVTDVRVHADGVQLRKVHPSGPSDIFAGEDLIILARYQGSGASTLRFDGQTSAGPVSWTSRVAFPDRSRENPFVARLWATQRVGYLSAEKRKHGASTEIDDEIRQLGDRYGIPTEFSSYLVLEPGMNPPGLAQPALSGRSVVGGQARLNAAVTTGLAGAVAGAPIAGANTQSFEAAKMAAAQRAAMNVASADSVSGLRDRSNFRRAGNRVFIRRDSSWTDTRVKPDWPVLKVKPYSDAYFRIVDLLPELRESFAIGEHVRVGGRAMTIELASAGVETLSARSLAMLREKW